MSFYSDASLVMIPSGYKTSKVYSAVPTDGAGDLSFSRSNDTATRVNSAGLIEKVRTNLALYSEDQTAWTDQNETSVTANAAANPLNGAVTADKVIPSAVTTDHYRGLSMGSMIGEISSSIYVKADGYSIIDYGVYNSTALNYPVRAVFDLSTQAITYINGSIASITSVGSGWYRISVTASVASTGTMQIYHRVRPSGTSGTYSGNGTSGMLLWGCQLESGVTTPYIGPTTSAAVSVGPVANVPRLDYLNSSCPRLLLEPQRTNLVTYSEQLNQWNGSNVTITANTSQSPDGYQNADNVNITATNGYWRRSPLTFASSTSYAASVFVKKSATTGTKTFKFYYNNNSLAPNNGEWKCVVDLTNITATTTTAGTDVTGKPTILSAKLVDYGNDWYRVEVAFTIGSGAGNSSSEIGFEANGVAVDFDAYGAQLEAGAYATSYIPTLGAAVTRGADACYKTGVSSLIGQTEGTLFVDFVFNNYDTVAFIPITLTNTSADQVYLLLDTNGQVGADFYFNSSFSARIYTNSGFLVKGTRYKMALVYKENDFALYINGQQIGTDNSGIVRSMTSAYFVYPYVGGYGPSGNTINQALLFKTRLTNAALAELTSL